jgi:hypothetical protein
MPAGLWQDQRVLEESALLIEQLAVNAWPAATVQLVDGWLLRSTPGVARRRSNSALPSPDAAQASAAQQAQVLDLPSASTPDATSRRLSRSARQSCTTNSIATLPRAATTARHQRWC